MTRHTLRKQEFFTANEAVAAIAPFVGSRFQARQILADALHLGDLIAFVEKFYEVSDVDPTDPWELLVQGATKSQSNVEVGPSTWQVSYCWPEETRYWRWPDSNFLINASEDPIEYFAGILLEGVELERSSVMSLVGRTSRAGIGGRKPDTEKWADYWVEFIYHETKDVKDWASIVDKKEMLERLQMYNEEVFSDKHADVAVESAWRGLVERQRLDRLSKRR